MTRRAVLLAIVASAFVASGLPLADNAARAATAHKPVVIFAAASLKNAIDDCLAAWRKKTGQDAVASYAGTPALARQIASGAPADIFISADQTWMDEMFAGQLMRDGSRRDIAANRLVLVVPNGARVPDGLLPVRPGMPLAQALGSNGRLAMASPEFVPAGRYAMAALKNLRTWEAVAQRLATTANVRVALALVARGEAPVGIVYASDARAEPKVIALAPFAQSLHPPIRYPAAILKDSRHPLAHDLADFLTSATARALIEKNGFDLITQE